MVESMQRVLPELMPSLLGGVPPPVEYGWERDDWQRDGWRRVWSGVQSHPWRALALVPGEAGIPTVEIAKLLMRIGRQQGEPICVADLRDAPNYAGAFLDVVAYHLSHGQRIILPTDLVTENLTVPIARGADCVILCATLGSTSIRSVEETIFQIGRERFIGTVLVRASSADRNGSLSKRPNGRR